MDGRRPVHALVRLIAPQSFASRRRFWVVWVLGAAAFEARKRENGETEVQSQLPSLSPILNQARAVLHAFIAPEPYHSICGSRYLVRPSSF